MSKPRRSAYRRIARAITAHNEVIADPGTSDTILMQATGGRIFTKGGVDEFQGTGVLPGNCRAGVTALDIALKVAVGDISGKFREDAETEEGRVRLIVIIEVLRQLGVFSPVQLETLSSFEVCTTTGTGWRWNNSSRPLYWKITSKKTSRGGVNGWNLHMEYSSLFLTAIFQAKEKIPHETGHPRTEKLKGNPGWIHRVRPQRGN